MSKEVSVKRETPAKVKRLVEQREDAKRQFESIGEKLRVLASALDALGNSKEGTTLRSMSYRLGEREGTKVAELRVAIRKISGGYCVDEKISIGEDAAINRTGYKPEMWEQASEIAYKAALDMAEHFIKVPKDKREPGE